MSETLTRLKEEYGDAEALRGYLSGYLAEKGLSQAQVEKESGVSTSVLSQFLKGKYPGDNEEASRKLLIWLASRERRTSLMLPLAGHNYIRTPSSERVLAVLSFAQVAGDSRDRARHLGSFVIGAPRKFREAFFFQDG